MREWLVLEGVRSTWGDSEVARWKMLRMVGSFEPVLAGEAAEAMRRLGVASVFGLACCDGG